MFIQKAQDSAMAWTERLTMMQPGTDIASEVVHNIHDVQVKEQRGFGMVTGLLVGLSIHALVPALSSSFWSTFSALGAVCSRAALVCMLSMTSQSLARNNGHLGDTLSDLTNG